MDAAQPIIFVSIETTRTISASASSVFGAVLPSARHVYDRRALQRGAARGDQELALIPVERPVPSAMLRPTDTAARRNCFAISASRCSAIAYAIGTSSTEQR